MAKSPFLRARNCREKRLKIRTYIINAYDENNLFLEGGAAIADGSWHDVV
jgi:hypothetical protein